MPINSDRAAGRSARRRRRGVPVMSMTVATIAAAGASFGLACSSSSQTDLTVWIGHAHVPNKDWASIGDKSDAYAKIMIDDVHKKSETIYNNNHPTFDARLHLGCVYRTSTMQVELRDLDSLST